MQEILNIKFGIDNFKNDLEKEISEAICKGDRDVYVCLGNKIDKSSLAFLIPCLTKNSSFAMIITPIVAYAMDQVRYLQSKNILAYCWNANMPNKLKNFIKKDIVSKNPKIKLLYVTPWQCNTLYFQVLLSEIKPKRLSYFVIDEVDCLSSQNFTRQYHNVIELRHKNIDIPLVTMTSVTSEEIKDEILHKLNMKLPLVFFMPNVELNSQKSNKTIKILDKDFKLDANVLLQKEKKKLYKKPQTIHYCEHLQSITAEKQLQKIKNKLYKKTRKTITYCEHLQSITAEEQLQKIKNKLYKKTRKTITYCEHLQSITAENQLQKIKNKLYKKTRKTITYCEHLQSITAEKQLQNIKNKLYKKTRKTITYCEHLQSITAEKQLQKIKNKLYKKTRKTIIYCEHLQRIMAQKELQTIKELLYVKK